MCIACACDVYRSQHAMRQVVACDVYRLHCAICTHRNLQCGTLQPAMCTDRFLNLYRPKCAVYIYLTNIILAIDASPLSSEVPKQVYKAEEAFHPWAKGFFTYVSDRHFQSAVAVVSVSGALSIKSMNWSSFGVMMICVRLLRCLPNSVSLDTMGLYSPRPAADSLLGSTP